MLIYIILTVYISFAIGIGVYFHRKSKTVTDFVLGGRTVGPWITAFAYGTSSVTLKMISGRETPATITAYQLLSGGAVLIAIGLAAGGSVHGFTVKSTILFLYMALLSTVAFTIWAELVKYNPVGTVAIFGFSIPVFGVALSALFLHENVWTIQNLAALVLVSIGILIVNS